jgi:hypothetical protein
LRKLQFRYNQTKITGTLHEDLLTFMTALVTDVTMVTEVTTDFGYRGYQSYNVSYVLWTFPVLLNFQMI